MSESRYVIHHEDCYGRVVGRIPDGLSRSEYFSHPERYQFEVAEISRSGSAYVIKFVRPVDGVPPTLRRETLPAVRRTLDRLQPLPMGGRR